MKNPEIAKRFLLYIFVKTSSKAFLENSKIVNAQIRLAKAKNFSAYNFAFWSYLRYVFVTVKFCTIQESLIIISNFDTKSSLVRFRETFDSAHHRRSFQTGYLQETTKLFQKGSKYFKVNFNIRSSSDPNHPYLEDPIIQVVTLSMALLCMSGLSGDSARALHAKDDMIILVISAIFKTLTLLASTAIDTGLISYDQDPTTSCIVRTVSDNLTYFISIA